MGRARGRDREREEEGGGGWGWIDIDKEGRGRGRERERERETPKLRHGLLSGKLVELITREGEEISLAETELTSFLTDGEGKTAVSTDTVHTLRSLLSERERERETEREREGEERLGEK